MEETGWRVGKHQQGAGLGLGLLEDVQGLGC